MGTQQLLYIILGVIVIGLAIITGMNMLDTYYEESNREQLISTSYTLLSIAEQYYKKPTDLGGGGESYRGWDIPQDMKRTDFGTFRVNARNNRVNIVALGVVDGTDGRRPVRVVLRVTRNNRYPEGRTQLFIRN